MTSSFDLLRSARSVVTTAPAVEPVTLSEAKAHLRRTDTAEDATITALIVAAREKVEQDTGRALITQTHDVYFDDVPCYGAAILLPNGRLQSVTSLKYYDDANAEATFSSANYLVDTSSEPSRIILNANKNWPDATVTLRSANAIIVRAVFGYGTAAAVPQALKEAMLLLVGAMFEHREQVIVAQFAGQFLALPFGYDQLIAPYKMWIV